MLILALRFKMMAILSGRERLVTGKKHKTISEVLVLLYF